MPRIFKPGELTPINEGQGRVFKKEELTPVIPEELSSIISSKPKEPVLTSAGKDFKRVAEGIYELGKAGAYTFVPTENNTLLKIGKYFEEAHERGELADDAWNFTKEMILSPIRNVAKDVDPIIQEGITKGTSQAAENIARRPFSFALDVLSLTGLGKAATGAIKGGAAVATGKSMKQIGERLAKSEAISAARPAVEIVDDIPAALDKLNDQISMAYDTAIGSLPKDPALAFKTADVVSIFDDAIKEIGKPVGKSSRSAVATLEDYKKTLAKEYKATISPAELKSIIKDLDNDIDWNTPQSGVSNKAIKNIRHKTDTMLKAKFPGYEKAMEPLADLVGLKEEVLDTLKISQQKGEWVMPDATASRISRLFKGQPKKQTIDTLSKFGEKTGLNLVEEMSAFTAGELFDRPVTQGSWRPGAGAAVGFMASGGSPTGLAKGAAIGAVLDKWGGVALGKTIDIGAPVFRGIGGAAEKIPSAAMAIPAGAEAIKSAYKRGEISREEAISQLKGKGFK